jgi:hypothetical protein
LSAVSKSIGIMDQFVEGKNPYTILGLEKGQKSTPDDIKKVDTQRMLLSVAAAAAAAGGSAPADFVFSCRLTAG